MNHRQAYLDLQEKHRQELNDFPIAYAFNEKQLEEALEKLGATKEECVTVYGHGDIMKRTDVKEFKAMLRRHTLEVHDTLKADKEFAQAAFEYEMDNHEYAINWDGDDAIFDCFAIDYEWLVKNELEDAYRNARKAHYKNMMEWGVI